MLHSDGMFYSDPKIAWFPLHNTHNYRLLITIIITDRDTTHAIPNISVLFTGFKARVLQKLYRVYVGTFIVEAM